ncbi:MAG: hypothetical protein ACOH5I_11335 [Oligoflexus sp.]
MILSIFRKTFLNIVWISFLLSTASFAGSGKLETFQVGDNPLIELPGPKKTAAQVRIPLELRPYEKILAQRPGQSGKQIEYRVIKPLKHVLRARMERTNHFYVGEWHIESVPVRWIKEERTLELNLRVYKRYGDSQELEELVGNLQLTGNLKGTGDQAVYTFTGQGAQRFLSKHGHPIVDLVVGPTAVESVGQIAKQADGKPPAKN